MGLVSTSVPLKCVICVSGTSKLCVSGTTLNIPLSQPVHFILAQRDFVCSVSTEGRSSREAALSLVMLCLKSISSHSVSGTTLKIPLFIFGSKRFCLFCVHQGEKQLGGCFESLDL